MNDCRMFPFKATVNITNIICDTVVYVYFLFVGRISNIFTLSFTLDKASRPFDVAGYVKE